MTIDGFLFNLWMVWLLKMINNFAFLFWMKEKIKMRISFVWKKFNQRNNRKKILLDLFIERWIVQIVSSYPLSSRKVRISTNLSLHIRDQFERFNYHELNWIYSSLGKFGNSNRYVFLSVSRTGMFHIIC